MIHKKEKIWLLKEKYQGVESDAFLADVKRLETGEPLAYLIGSIPFLDCTIYLDSQPLIPRPETEYWVEQAIKTIKTPSSRQDLELGDGHGPTSNLTILDLCAGSGAIGVAVAKAVKDAGVTFIEIGPSHLSTIKKNLNENTTIYDSERYKILESNLFDKLGNKDKFDFILTNPPYIDAKANTVDINVENHEPHLALFGGNDGMEIITKIINSAKDHLTPTGQLWIEHEPFQSEAIKNLAERNGYQIVTHLDQYQVARFSVLCVTQ
jgi:release factor glutamine methyltransferase